MAAISPVASPSKSQAGGLVAYMVIVYVQLTEELIMLISLTNAILVLNFTRCYSVLL